MSKLSLPLSAFAGIDKVIRLQCRIQARINGLTLQYRLHGMPDGLIRQMFEEDLDDLQSLYYRLVNSSVVCSIYSSVLSDFAKFPKSTSHHAVRLFGSVKRDRYYVNDPVLDEVLDSMKEGMLHGRKAELLRRLLIEVENRTNSGWYLVFNTLSCEEGTLDKVFPPVGTRTSVWTDYVRHVDRMFAEASHGSYRKGAHARLKGDDFHLYFAVVEKGSKTGRLHIHVLHLFRDVPLSFSDPNLGSTQPINRAVDDMKSLWKFGFSDPRAVRFGANDAWSKLGWRWPVKFDGVTKTYQPIPFKPTSAVCNYVSKYVTKALIDKEPGCIWRTRISRKLGKLPLQEVLDRMSLKHKLTLLQCRSLKLNLGSSKLPRMLTRRLVLKSLPKEIFNVLCNRARVRPPNNLFHRMRSMIAGKPVFSAQNFGIIPIRRSRVLSVSNFFERSQLSVGVAGSCYATS